MDAMTQLAENCVRASVAEAACNMVGSLSSKDSDVMRADVRKLLYQKLEELLSQPEGTEILKKKLYEAIAGIKLDFSKRY